MPLNLLIEKDKDGYFARILQIDACVLKGDAYKESFLE